MVIKRHTLGQHKRERFDFKYDGVYLTLGNFIPIHQMSFLFSCLSMDNSKTVRTIATKFSVLTNETS